MKNFFVKIGLFSLFIFVCCAGCDIFLKDAKKRQDAEDLIVQQWNIEKTEDTFEKQKIFKAKIGSERFALNPMHRAFIEIQCVKNKDGNTNEDIIFKFPTDVKEKESFIMKFGDDEPIKWSANNSEYYSNVLFVDGPKNKMKFLFTDEKTSIRYVSSDLKIVVADFKSDNFQIVNEMLEECRKTNL